METFTIKTDNPEMIAKLKELKSQAQAKEQKSPVRLEKAKQRKFVAASRNVAKSLTDLHGKFDTKLTGKHEAKNYVDLGDQGFFEVTIAIRRRNPKKVEGTAEGNDAITAFSEEIKGLVLESLNGLNQKESLSKQDFQAHLASVEGYEASMWDELKGLLEKDPKSTRGRGTKFFPRLPQAPKAAKTPKATKATKAPKAPRAAKKTSRKSSSKKK